MRYLLNVLYLALLIAVLPVLVYKSWRTGKYRRGWGEKLLGRVSPRISKRSCIWFHAVSVGEVLQLEPIVERLPDGIDVVVSTTTSTGHNVAKRKFAEHTVCYFPLDFTWAVHSAMNRIQPDLIGLVELELWPNFIAEAHRRNIPTLVVNGRLSENSFRGYRKLGPFVRSIISKLTSIGAQTTEYAERFIELGANQESVAVTGSVKFDRIQTNRESDEILDLRSQLGIQDDELVFLAGSTHAPEEEAAISAWQHLRTEFPKLRLLIAPRHAERFDEVADLIEAFKLPICRKSQRAVSASHFESGNSPVILLDTLGELSTAWGLADVAFVGGSLTQRGGQNMLEPAAFGAAVVLGPNTWNFKDVVESLVAEDAVRMISTSAELGSRIESLLNSPIQRLEMGRNAQKWIASQQGGADRTVEMIATCLPEVFETHSNLRTAA